MMQDFAYLIFCISQGSVASSDMFQVWSLVRTMVTVLLQIYCKVQQRKSFENVNIFEEVVSKR